MDGITEIPYDVIRKSKRQLAAYIKDLYVNIFMKGERVDKYFNNVEYVPEYVQKLVRKDKRSYTVEITNINSVEYKLAMFSLIDFASAENCAIWHKKCEKWLEGNK